MTSMWCLAIMMMERMTGRSTASAITSYGFHNRSTAVAQRLLDEASGIFAALVKCSGGSVLMSSIITAGRLARTSAARPFPARVM